MYAVIAESTLIYLGEDRIKATEALDDAPDSALISVSNLDELADYLNEDNEEGAEILSDAAVRIFEKLEELGFTAENAEELAQKVRTNGEKAVAEVRSLGIRGMKAVGEGFIALGDLLRKAGDQQDEDDEDFLDQLRKL